MARKKEIDCVTHQAYCDVIGEPKRPSFSLDGRVDIAVTPTLREEVLETLETNTGWLTIRPGEALLDPTVSIKTIDQRQANPLESIYEPTSQGGFVTKQWLDKDGNLTHYHLTLQGAVESTAGSRELVKSMPPIAMTPLVKIVKELNPTVLMLSNEQALVAINDARLLVLRKDLILSPIANQGKPKDTGGRWVKSRKTDVVYRSSFFDPPYFFEQKVAFLNPTAFLGEGKKAKRFKSLDLIAGVRLSSTDFDSLDQQVSAILRGSVSEEGLRRIVDPYLRLETSLYSSSSLR